MRKRFLPFVIMALLTAASVGAQAQSGVENYVSASGYVLYHAPSVFSPNGSYAWDFEQEFEDGHINDWLLIDADGDTHNWQLPLTSGMGHNGSDGMLVSYSYDNSTTTPLAPNNYMVSPRVTLPQNAVISFWTCAMDEQYCAEHFGVAISTTVNNDPQAFTMLEDWTLTAKGQGTRQGNWYQFSVDLSNYGGQDVYLAIRHFNVSDMFAICVDDILIGDENATALTGSDIILDGQTVATNQRGTRFLLNTEGFADGSSHTTTIRAHYQGGTTAESTCNWTFRSSEHFQGSPDGLRADSDGSIVELSWTLPTMSSPFPIDELFYDFSDSTLMDLTLIDANHDGQNFRVYPYGGYGGGIGLRSWSWVNNTGALNPDNYIVTPRLTATENTVFSFKACDADMPGIAPDHEHFGVAVSTTGNTNAADFTMVQEWNSTGTYTEYSVDLSAYAGQQIYIALRHFNTTGETYFLCVDDIKVRGIEAEVNRPAIGALVYADDALIASLSHGETSFTHYVNRYTSEYCIRIIQDGSRTTGDYYALAAPQCANADLECLAPKNLRAENLGDKVRISWEREIYTGFEEDPQGWTFLDADGDGSNFGIYVAGGMNPDGSVNTTDNPALVSFSYINDYGALNPDNYAFMPKIKVMENASMTFYAAGFDPNYATEHFGVAVASSDGLEVATIAEWDSRNPYQRYTIDLSAYEGQEIFLGFRHFTHASNYALCIDNITVTNAVWAGTVSQTYGYYVYRSTDGQHYDLIGTPTGTTMHFDDNESNATTYYYKVTAINVITSGECESAPAMATDGIHDYVTAHTDGLMEKDDALAVYPNPTRGQVTIEAEGLQHITLINTLGQVLYDASTESERTTIDFAGYEVGLYLIRITTINGTQVRQLSIKE